MPVKSLNSIFCVLVLLLLAVHTVIVSEARLSTFKVDIQTKRDAAGSTTDVLTEASKLLRKHFIRTSNYSDEEWKTLVKECEKIDDKREVSHRDSLM